jgi:outer membrane protein OmpA-like peptidoglycan-associated protein
MIKVLITCLIVIFTAYTSVNAQTKSTKKADVYFEQKDYVKAIKAYSKFLDHTLDSYVLEQLGYCELYLNNETESLKWFEKATKKSQNANMFYDYAQLIKSTKNDALSNEKMKEFAAKFPKDTRAIAFNKKPNYLAEIKNKKQQYKVNSLSINTSQSDFGAVLVGNELYFASARNTKEKVFSQTKEPFLEVYTCNRIENESFSQPTLLKEINSTWNDGPVSVSKDKKTLYFASESFRIKKSLKKKYAHLSTVWLFSANFQDNQWRNIQSLPFGSEAYSTGNPSVSNDGKTLYFSSNMPGGFGGNDIWKVVINSNGTYGNPENLGALVNTPSDESFPSIDEDNSTLFFASKGHLGLGGYDVFKIKLGSESVAENLGLPINSEKDDFSFCFYESQKIGFVSSNRIGNDDVFIVTPLMLPANNASNEEILHPREAQKETQVIASNHSEKFNESLNIETKKEILFDFNTFTLNENSIKALDQLIKTIKSNNQNIEINSYTDTRGSNEFNLILSQKRAQAVAAYLYSKGIDKSSVQYNGFGEENVKIDCGNDCTEQQHQENRRTEIRFK